ncbi:hypothetical protein F8O07_07115 [Pseudoclavibacter sp. CFCC 13796]|uniref:hypothetical protein n=1 Tax=Pseudoclavibacter sp. CFCC 13796 TaxID=2615179 RepID=UPI0013010D3D|nr:hypothetical protein [Pseudoclavibacter sp. CFCC 13796]KAB1661667.1 hypothetical protein F8O07_07115 [Pseudoclavibacter sp. CFCC 13796]
MNRLPKTLTCCAAGAALLVGLGFGVVAAVSGHQAAAADQRVIDALRVAHGNVVTGQGDNDDQSMTIPQILVAYDQPADVTYTATPEDTPVHSLTSWTVTGCLGSTCHTIDQNGAIDPVHDDTDQVNTDDLPQPTQPETEHVDATPDQN